MVFPGMKPQLDDDSPAEVIADSQTCGATAAAPALVSPKNSTGAHHTLPTPPEQPHRVILLWHSSNPVF